MYLKSESKTKLIPGPSVSDPTEDTKKTRAKVCALILSKYIGMWRAPDAVKRVSACA